MRLNIRAQIRPRIAPWLILAALLCAGLVLRIATFGDPALHTDEEFYFLVGQRLLDGSIPYVDIWDRKPPGLFLIYAAIAAISRDVLAYQIAAWLSASLTAFTISRIVAGWTGWRGQLFAGLVYIACIAAVGGYGGQAPVFYNLPMAVAALLVIRAIPDFQIGTIPPQVYSAMLLCGVALTIKQMTIAESLYLGIFALIMAARAGMTRPVRALVGFGLIAAAPFTLFAALYALGGYWPEFFQAMVLSNFNKAHYPADAIALRALAMLLNNALLLILALVGAWMTPVSPERRFLIGWLLAALVGLALVPNFYWHYALPLLIPLSALAASLFDRPLTGPVCASVAIVLACYEADAFNFALHRQARINTDALAASIIQHDPRGTMLVYDGPVYLFAMTGATPLSRLVFPWHLTETVERYASGGDAREEVQRILARRPGVIVLGKDQITTRQDSVGRKMAVAYVGRHCRKIDERVIFESRRRDKIVVWGDCQ